MDLLAKSALTVDDVVAKAKDWALLNGLTMRPKNKKSGSFMADRLEFVPFALLPSRFPRREYEAALAVQPLVNELMHRVAHDREFLAGALCETVRVDDFTRRLFEVYEAMEKETRVQSVSLGLLRSDYMLDTRVDGQGSSKAVCKQVEVNTIASGQGWIGTACSKLHRYILEEMDLVNYVKDMPENNPLEGLCRGMFEAWKIYNNPSAAILFIVENSTRHIGDQRFHEYELRRLHPQLRVLRLTLGQLSERAELSGADRRLLVDGREEIALVYLRSGYAPEQYAGEAEWRARMTIERSRAIKCPSIGYHLAGTKKVQQLLAQPGCLERFLMEPLECAKLRRFFTGLYSLDPNALGNTALAAALARPDDFVLKPQREGGANNFFGEALKLKLESMHDDGERLAWILMDRISPPVHRNYLVQPDGPTELRLQDVTSELGIFGVVLGDREQILVNETVGHTLRTKFAGSDEGGVSSGFGVCDSPLLV